MADMFPEGSVVRRVNLEPAIALGAGRALLLQIAHPVVAQGVQDHSEFKRNPFKRLQGTLEATYAAVFGPDDLARGVGRRIQWVHEFVTGPTYRANDPDHLLWVHATLVDTALGCYLDFVGPLADDDAETYYQEMTQVAELFGVPRDAQPATLAEFRAYVDATVASMDVSDVGRDLAAFILDPVLPLGLHVPFRPLLRLQRHLTVGRLPAPIRERLELTWSEHDQARLATIERRIRGLMSLTPRPLRTAGPRLNGLYLLWLARRHVRQFDDHQRRDAERQPLAS